MNIIEQWEKWIAIEVTSNIICLFLVVSRVRSSSRLTVKANHTLPSFTIQTPRAPSIQHHSWAYSGNIHHYNFLPPRKTLIPRHLCFTCQHPSPRVNVSNPRSSTFLTKLTRRISLMKTQQKEHTARWWTNRNGIPWRRAELLLCI